MPRPDRLHRPSVSIGLPTYNRREHLARAIESVLAQTHADFELIVSDNASTDGTEELCREFAARDSRIRYVRHEANQGSTGNFNWLFCALDGEYALLVGDDDWLDPGYVAACLAVLERDPTAAVAVGRSRYYRPDGAHESDLAQPAEVLDDSPIERVRSYYALEPKPETFYGLLRGSALSLAAPMRNELYNDGIFAATLLFAGRLRVVPEVTIHRTRGGTSADWGKLLRELGKPQIQARVPQLVIAWHVFRDTAWAKPAYWSVPLPRRVRLAAACAAITFSWRGLAFALLGPAIARIGSVPGMRWTATAVAGARRRWGTGQP